MGKAPNGPATPPEEAAEPDPSMDDILASIRRILDEDQASKGPPEDVLMLEPSMLVEEPATSPAVATEPEPLAALPPAPLPPAPLAEASRPAMIPAVSDDPFPPLPAREATFDSAFDPGGGLVAPAAAAAAASSLGALRRTLAADRGAVVRSGGPSFEDVVREEMRPMLKAWLDAHLPPLVERLVKAEIERVVGGQAG